MFSDDAPGCGRTTLCPSGTCVGACTLLVARDGLFRRFRNEGLNVHAVPSLLQRKHGPLSLRWQLSFCAWHRSQARRRMGSFFPRCGVNIARAESDD